VTPIEDLSDYHWLISEQAAPWIDRAAGAGDQTTLSLVAALRRDLSATRAHLVVEQAALRQRGLRKFAAADRMFFTARALEQATDEGLAAYKAARFASASAVADLCCGIGGDLLSLAARGPATGVDRDPIMAILANANCQAVTGEADGRAKNAGLAGATDVVAADVESFDLSEFSAWHIDPDRRPGGRRTTRVELHEPGPEFIDRALAAVPQGAIKLAPAATLPPHWEPMAEQEWISRDGECRQLVCWFGELAQHPGARRATIVDDRGQCLRTIHGQQQDPPLARALAEYIYEPDAAILAAGLSGVLAAEHRLAAIAPGVAYFTSDALVTDPALACFRIEEVLPLDIRKLRQTLRARNIGRLEIKKRVVDVTPEKLRRDLRLSGSESATLLIAPLAGRPTAMLAQRVSMR